MVDRIDSYKTIIHEDLQRSLILELGEVVLNGVVLRQESDEGCFVNAAAILKHGNKLTVFTVGQVATVVVKTSLAELHSLAPVDAVNLHLIGLLYSIQPESTPQNAASDSIVVQCDFYVTLLFELSGSADIEDFRKH